MPMVPSRNHTVGSWRNTSALIRMENPMMPPTKELKPREIGNNPIDIRQDDSLLISVPDRKVFCFFVFFVSNYVQSEQS